VNKELNIPGDKSYLRLLERDKDFSDHIFNNSRSMISIINRNYIYEKVNSTFCNAHQLTADSVVGKSLEDVWGNETFQNIIKSNIDLCFSGKTVRYEAAFYATNLGKRYFEVVFRPISVESGEITHLIAETFDIDELVSSKQAVIEKEEEFRKFETNLPVGFLRCNADGKILHANQAFLTIMGCHNKTAIKKMNLKSFYQNEELFEIQRDQLLESSKKSFGRVPLKNPEGNEITCRISGFLAVDDSGIPSFIDFAIEDASHEMMLERRLFQAQKLETIGALAGGIAHDFNNILATISGYSEMLHEDLPLDSDISDKITKIQRAVLKGRSITNQILTFSRQVEQEKIEVSVSEVLRETLGFIKSSVPHSIKIKSSIPKKNVIVFADPTQLFRVFLNLMTNALQSMEDEGGIFSVFLEVVKGKDIQHKLHKDIVADEYVQLSFEDTGKGMEQSVISRIFEPFYTTREVGQGTGLGLSVVHGIVSELEGEVLVSSKREEGSVFYVLLPLSKEYPKVIVEKGKSKKILFIAGNKYESRILSLALKNTGNELVYVSDQCNLLKVMSLITERPDLVIYMSDSVQIKADDFVKVFRDQKSNIPCILITDNNRSQLEEKLLHSGIIKHHLIKPVSLKEIRNAIQASLK